MPEPTRTPELDPATRRALAAGLFDHTWELLERPNRTAAQDDELVHCAHASRYHWGELGESVRLARGECRRAANAGARRHGCARACTARAGAASRPSLTPAAAWRSSTSTPATRTPCGAEDWDRASAFEGLARACLVAGDLAAAASWRAKAESELAGIADPEDRRIIEQDLATPPT